MYLLVFLLLAFYLQINYPILCVFFRFFFVGTSHFTPRVFVFNFTGGINKIVYFCYCMKFLTALWLVFKFFETVNIF